MKTGQTVKTFNRHFFKNNRIKYSFTNILLKHKYLFKKN